MCANYRSPDADDVEFVVKPKGARHYATNAAIFIFFVALILVGVFVITPWVEEQKLDKDLERANWLVTHGPMEEAVAIYDEILGRAPQNSAIYRRAFQARESAGGYVEEAILLKHQADDAYKSEEYVKAMKTYQMITEKYPLSQAGRTSEREWLAARHLACRRHDALATSAMNEKRWFGAKQSLDQVLALNPEWPGAAENLKKTEAAISAFQKMMDAGKSAAEAARWPESRSYYEKALDIVPGSQEAYDGRALALKNIPPPPGMVLIEPGYCVLGPGEKRPEPVKIRMDGFYMDATEVTNGEYRKFVEATKRQSPAYWTRDNASELSRLPVICISWQDAAAYAAWAGKRLPAADEWERAARGREGRPFPWGNTFEGTEAAHWYNAAPVAAMPKDVTAEGCYDMSGNVCEWTADEAARPQRWPPYPTGQTYRPPTWYDSAKFRAVCGESFAGLESDRMARFVMKALAEPTLDPRIVAMVDKPGLYGVEVMAACDTYFIVRDIGANSMTVEMRKWLDERENFAAFSTSFAPGEKIKAKRSAAIRQGHSYDRIELEIDTHWTLKEIVTTSADQLAGARALCESENGLIMSFGRSSEPRLGAINFDLPKRTTKLRTDRDELLRLLSARSLKDSAYSGHRRSAPEIGKYINVGFRCVKDL